ncbi:hypothetical protein BCR41DRAFT_360629 [Lobosporangium transversale]|uniref:Uncharacterized protein n=1 Tax=Lobosporangium transversale TaxID=64571 RepID=A0A1Y2GC62_9FUNG|nr:hypothetical protein BCR41DRAFT_360629 [Lobosporangium transversale]ORZ06754.1 hypothetical protein BCR41DRAFT_360629 [Lobosporangium transversale]|eukprot:XP_021877675.1 hypothetical protein BCR41DRAFT_360629 [Lobosporangium transversale]
MTRLLIYQTKTLRLSLAFVGVAADLDEVECMIATMIYKTLPSFTFTRSSQMPFTVATDSHL